MAARRSFVKNSIRRISRWPSPRAITFYNDGESYHLQSDRERKRYKQVRRRYTKITRIFSAPCANFGTFSDITIVFVVITFPLTANL